MCGPLDIESDTETWYICFLSDMHIKCYWLPWSMRVFAHLKISISGSSNMLWQSDVAHWQAGGLGHSTHFNVTTTAMAPRQLLSQPHCRDGPGTRSWAEYGAAAHARCVAPTLDHFGANSGQKRPGIRPAWLGHGAPRERQRHRSVRRTKTAYFSHCVLF